MSQLEQQMRHRDREMVPRVLVQAMFALMAASLAIVAYAQWFDVPNRGVLIEAPIVQSIDVTIIGDRSGRYVVMDANGVQLASSTDEMSGFISVMGRAIDRNRLNHDLPSNLPVQVVRRENGNIAVIDNNAGRSIELIGYGKDNVAAFAKLLD